MTHQIRNNLNWWFKIMLLIHAGVHHNHHRHHPCHRIFWFKSHTKCERQMAKKMLRRQIKLYTDILYVWIDIYERRKKRNSYFTAMLPLLKFQLGLLLNVQHRRTVWCIRNVWFHNQFSTCHSNHLYIVYMRNEEQR